MFWFLLLSGAIWGLGHIMKSPPRARLVIIGILYLAILLAVWLLPPGAGPRSIFTGGLVEWLLVAVGIGGVAGYVAFLRNMKARATAPSQAETKPGTFAETELNRYARHIVLREIGGPGQKKLKKARVLVVGAGGLGAPALQYLAAAGVGTIGIVDDDVVDNSNLQRQVIHRDDHIGMPKVFSAEIAMKALNPFLQVLPYNRRLTEEFASPLIADFDLVLDGTDNFETRYLVNRVCVAQKKPLIAAALTQWEGQISTYDPANGTPCYQCVFPQAPDAALAPSCAEAGVLGPLPGVLGSMMAVEAIKTITGAGQGLQGRMMIYDALYGENRTISLKKRADCEICGEAHSGTEPAKPRP